MKKFTLAEALAKANAVHNFKYGYELIKKFRGFKHIYPIKCPVTGHPIFQQDFSSHVHNKNGCPQCGVDLTSKAKTRPLDIVIEIANKVHNFKYGYDLIKRYNKRDDNYPIQCFIKGHPIFYQTLHNHLEGRGCPVCGLLRRSEFRRDTTEKFIRKSEIIWPDLHRLFNMDLVTYGKNSAGTIDVSCRKRGHGIFKTTPARFLRGYGCPKCSNISIGERFIKDWLIKNNIKFDHIKKYDDLVGKLGKKYSYDFYIPEHNYLIEYNGLFHYNENPLIRNSIKRKNALIRQKHNDKEKFRYAKDKGIRLLRISYRDFNRLDYILTKYFIK